MMRPADGQGSSALFADPSGDDIAAFYRANVNDVLSFFQRRTSDPELAADLTSETFARMITKQEQFDPDTGTIEQWMYTIARNLLQDFWRKSKVSTSAQRQLAMAWEPLDTESARRLSAAESEDRVVELVSAVNGLAANQRDAVALRVFDGLDYRQIATRLGCSAGAARVRVLRGLRTLEKTIEV